MTHLLKRFFLVILLGYTVVVLGQDTPSPVLSVLSFEEYIGYVKAHHPIMKQAELRLTEGEANLLRARGGFDPKIDVDYDRKQFKDTEYWDILNTTFKIPTWYGLEFKANYEQNTGEFLNREFTVPEDGLYSVGVSLDIARGFLINDRMANLRKAKFFREQTKAERDLLLNDLIFEAAKAYLDWIEAYNEEQIYVTFLANAEQRFDGIKRSVIVGDKAAIDSTEARITFQSRQLNLEAARLKRLKAALKASNFLWVNNVPVEIREGVYPTSPSLEILQTSLTLDGITDTEALLESHPKLRSLDAKIDGLRVDRSLKRNKLLPKLNLEYNFLTPENDDLSALNTADYKGGVTFQMPLFLRKERGDARLANVKLQDANLDRLSASLKLQNTITATNQEIISLDAQQNLIVSIVDDYERLVRAEERKFELGESSLFLINSREQKLIESQLKRNTLEIKSLKATVGLFNALGLTL